MGGGPFVPLRARKKKSFFFCFLPLKCRDMDQLRWGTLSRNFVRCPLVVLLKPSDFHSTSLYSEHDPAITRIRIVTNVFFTTGEAQARIIMMLSLTVPESAVKSSPKCGWVVCQ